MGLLAIQSGKAAAPPGQEDFAKGVTSPGMRDVGASVTTPAPGQ
jgi:hypothetical protein